MANDRSKQGSTWPIPKFHFQVHFGSPGQSVGFTEVSGLESDAEIIEYRDGDSKTFSALKMPGIAKYGKITMKRGVFTKDNEFWTWYDAIKMNIITRRTVTIRLLGESAQPLMAWTLSNAWPTKVAGIDLKSGGNEVAVETLELACDGITMVNTNQQ